MVEALPIGTQLHCGKQSYYKLTGEICRGGTAILYSAALHQNGKKNPAELVIKEACPKDIKEACPKDSVFCYVRGDDGVTIHPETESIEANFRLTQCQEALKREAEMGYLLFKKTFRAVKIETILSVKSIKLPGKDPIEFKAGQFGCLHSTLGKGNYVSELLPRVKSLYELAMMIEKILDALAFFHRVRDNDTSWVHGDLSPKNILLEDREDEPFSGEALFIDFGSSYPVHGPGPDAATNEIPYLLSTGLYAAPEMYENPVRLTRAADIFAVGCIMLKALGLLPTHDPDTDLFLMIKSDLDTKLKEFGGTPPAIQKAKEILKKALNQDPAARYPTAMEMLKDVTGLVEMLAPVTAFPSQNLGTSEELYQAVLRNRASDLRDIDASFQHANVYFVHGMGGVGKSQLALAYALSRYPHRALRLFYKDSLKDTIRNLSCSAGNAKSEEERYNEKLDFLRKYCQDALIIIDNLSRNRSEWINDPAFLDIQNLPAKIIFTTRGDPQDDRFPGKRLCPPEPEDMLEYFCQRLGSGAMENMKQHLGLPTMDDLRRRIFVLSEKVHFHPLCCEIMAKTLRRNTQSATLEQLEAAFQDLHNSRLPKIAFTKDVTQEELDVYHHLVRLFELQNLNESETVLLKRAFLLPEGGMQERLFLGEEADSDLLDSYDQLVDGSLLNCNDGIVSIHPLIREVIHELQPALADCESYLNAQYDQWDPDAYSNVQSMQLGELFQNAHDAFDTPELKFAHHAADCFHNSHSHIGAALRLANNYATVNQTAKAYSLLGDVYSSCGKYQLAHFNYQKALNLAAAADPVDFSEVAKEYTALAVTKQNAQMKQVILRDLNSSEGYSSASIALEALNLLQLDPKLSASMVNYEYETVMGLTALDLLKKHTNPLDPQSFPREMRATLKQLVPLYLSIGKGIPQRIKAFGLEPSLRRAYYRYANDLSNIACDSILDTWDSDQITLLSGSVNLSLTANAIMNALGLSNGSLVVSNLINIGFSYSDAAHKSTSEAAYEFAIGQYLDYIQQAVTAAEKNGDALTLAEAYAARAVAFADTEDEAEARKYAQLAYQQAEQLPTDPPVAFYTLHRAFNRSGWALPQRNVPGREQFEPIPENEFTFTLYNVTVHLGAENVQRTKKRLFELQYYNADPKEVELTLSKMLRYGWPITITNIEDRRTMTSKDLLNSGLEHFMSAYQIENALLLSGVSAQTCGNPLRGLKYLLQQLQTRDFENNGAKRTLLFADYLDYWRSFEFASPLELELVKIWLSSWYHFRDPLFPHSYLVLRKKADQAIIQNTTMSQQDRRLWSQIVNMVDFLDLGEEKPHLDEEIPDPDVAELLSRLELCGEAKALAEEVMNGFVF